MRFLIRADSSIRLGTGHIKRCLSLAGRLRERGAEIDFLCRYLPGSILDEVRERGYRVLTDELIQQDIDLDGEEDAEWSLRLLRENLVRPDWVVVDHYSLGRSWESRFKAFSRVMVIDDLANRAHDCDALLDQTLTNHPATRYQQYLTSQCKTFFGVRYALLQPQFFALSPRQRTGEINQILVFFGGTDATGQTVKAIKVARLLQEYDIVFNVVVGATNPKTEAILSEAVSIPSVCIHRDPDIAALMLQADLGLGAGGITTWERCKAGLPALLILVAENQREVIEAVSKAGAAISVGNDSVTPEFVAEVIRTLIHNPLRLQAMSQAAIRLMEKVNLRSAEDLMDFLFEQKHVPAK